MKVIIARCASDPAQSLEGREELVDVLQAEGHQTQLLDLPPIGSELQALTNLASLRLLPVEQSCDALICLDATATVLQHARKIVWLLDDSGANDEAPAKEALFAEDAYRKRVLRAALEEASALLLSSLSALQRHRAHGRHDAQLLLPTRPNGDPGTSARHAKGTGWSSLLKALA